MLKIRLQRIGRKNDPHFRVVVVESTRGPKSGNAVEILGSYNPHKNTATLNGERITHWMSHGAQVSDTVHNLLINEKIITGKKINVLPKKSPIIKEKKEEETPAVEDAPEEVTVEKKADADTDSEPKDEKLTENKTEEKEKKPDETPEPEAEKKEAGEVEKEENKDKKES